MKSKYLREENGVALVIALLLLLVTTFIGLAGVNTTVWDNLIAGNARASGQAFYVAEAGINEFMGRFRTGATNQIADSSPSSPNWRLFLAINTARAGTAGYTAGDHFAQSLQDQLDFRVKITHKVDLANNVVTDNGYPVYVITSYGFTADGANKVIEEELNRNPSFDAPGAIYSERPVSIHGSATYIQGTDSCGTDDKAGIITTLSNFPTDPITISGNPTIQGNPPKSYDVQNSSLRGMVDSCKGRADFAYDYTNNQTLSGYSDQWGTPASSSNSTPINYPDDQSMNIVYFNMHGNTLKLSGGSHGAGLLIVDGNVQLDGNFTWYGMIIAMGAVDYTGGGQKNVTGAILTGETTTISIDVGGNAGIIYCSKAINRIKNKVNLGPYKVTKWKDVS